MRICCKAATIAQKFKLLGEGHPNTQMGHPECIGHGFRRLFVTTLANDSSVSVEESLGSAGHSSVAAQRTYIQRDGVSECAKFAASGL